MKTLLALLTLVAAAAPASAAVDVSADTILRPDEYVLPYWWFSPTAVATCRGTDSAEVSAWFFMGDTSGNDLYRDSLGPTELGPGENETLQFAPYLPRTDGCRYIARCSVAAPGDTCSSNDVVVKPFSFVPPG